GTGSVQIVTSDGTLSDTDTISITVTNPAGIAGSPIDLGLDGTWAQGVVLTASIRDVPSDWSLNAGTNNGDGSWTVTTSDLSSLYITTPVTYAGALVLNVTESWVNAEGSAGSVSITDNVEAYPTSPIFAVSCDDTLTGGNGSNEFVFAQPIGNDRIYNFNASSDIVDLIGFGVSGYGDLVIANDAHGN